MDKENLTIRAQMAFRGLSTAINKAEADLISIIRDYGGIIPTPAADDKPALYLYAYASSDLSIDLFPIQAVAFDEGEGLMIISNTEMANYEYDNDYEFDYYGNFYGKDLEHYRDMVKDITYFRELNDGYTDVPATIFSILADLASYLA